MKMKIALFLLLPFAIISLGALAAIKPESKEACVNQPPELAGQNIGFELIDVLRRQAWITTDWTLEDYSDFSPSLGSHGLIKNEPRVGFATNTSVLRSPSCDEDGQFTYQTRFGRTFFHIADISQIGPAYGENRKIKAATVTKYHRLQFDPGQIISVLLSPAGEAFIRVNRPVEVTSIDPELPQDWTIQEFVLSGSWQADLFGKVQVLRLEDGTSYQGPVRLPKGDSA
ncbi:MAG: hypothetical protein AAFR69_00030 [Pseudomonadota bacterium]